MIPANAQLPSPGRTECRENFASTNEEFTASESRTAEEWQEDAARLLDAIREEFPAYTDLSGGLVSLAAGDQAYEFDVANRMGELVEMQEFSRSTVDAEEQERIDAAQDRARAGMQEKIGTTKRAKRWWVRGRFWALIAGGEAALSDLGVAIFFSALAMKEHGAGDPNSAVATRAHEQISGWMHLTDAEFFRVVAKYVSILGLSLETQAYLLFFIRQYFHTEPTALAGGEPSALRDELVACYEGALAGQEPPSSVMCARLAQGLLAMDATGQQVALNRAQCAEIAVMALWKVMDLHGPRNAPTWAGDEEE